MPTVSNRAELSALSSAKGGETITLAKGQYGVLDLNGSYASLVTIRSAAPRQADFDSIQLRGDTSNLRIEGVKVSGNGNGGPGNGLVNIASGAENVQVVGSEIHGKIDGVYQGYFGIYVRGASNVLLQNNDIHDVSTGIAGFGPRGIRVVDNRIDYTYSDPLKFGNVRDGLIEGNVANGHMYGGGKAHIDFIQILGSSSGIDIKDNVFLAKVPWAQGIFLHGGTYNDILIEGNIVSTGMARGISVQAGSGIVVQNNTVLNMPDGLHPATRIMLPPGSAARENITTDKVGKQVGSNLVLQNVDPKKPYWVEDYIQNGANGRALNPGDLKPVAGSLGAEIGAFGRSGGPSAGPDPAPAPSEPAPAPGPGVDPGIDPGGVDVVFSRPGDMEFSGAASAVRKVAHTQALEIEEGTVAFEFRAAKLAGTQGLFSKDAKGDAGGGNHVSAWLKSDTLNFVFQDDQGGDVAVIRAGGIKAGRTYEVAASFDGEEVSVWLDGRLVGSRAQDTDWTENVQDIRIGGLGWSSPSGSSAATSPFKGTISDVKIADAALSGPDIDALL